MVEEKEMARTEVISMKLNLGCGEKLLEGYINCDFYQKNADKKVDLNKLPLPFESNSIDEIILRHVLEHTEHQYELILECHRILKPKGKLIVALPPHLTNLQHKTFYHNIQYFEDVVKKKKTNRDSEKQLFNLISFKRNRSILHPYVFIKKIKRFYSYINSLLFNEYEWVMEKRK